MNATITARHCEISDELRTRASAVLNRLAGLESRATEGTVIFDQTPTGAKAEIRLTAAGETYHASAQEKDHRTALDRAEDKIRRQVEKSGTTRRGRGARDTV
ncbi:MAG TPA: HPF/RaiA family ribosome-associated protein [Gemmatimonadales bacterium]|nr:HPF/RaiA family ribosome-associated protein [Gemmatimonadales bacterium]